MAVIEAATSANLCAFAAICRAFLHYYIVGYAVSGWKRVRLSGSINGREDALQIESIMYASVHFCEMQQCGEWILCFWMVNFKKHVDSRWFKM